MNIEPLGDRVLVRPLEEELRTASGIILPETAKEKPQAGVVVAVSQDETEEIHVKVGDKVLFAKFSGTEIKVEGTEYIIMKETEVLARLGA